MQTNKRRRKIIAFGWLVSWSIAGADVLRFDWGLRMGKWLACIAEWPHWHKAPFYCTQHALHHITSSFWSEAQLGYQHRDGICRWSGTVQTPESLCLCIMRCDLDRNPCCKPTRMLPSRKSHLEQARSGYSYGCWPSRVGMCARLQDASESIYAMATPPTVSKLTFTISGTHSWVQFDCLFSNSIIQQR